MEAALDRKEILIARLKAMNDVAETGRHIDSVTRKLLPSFEREYAQAILDLRNVSHLPQSLVAAAALPVPEMPCCAISREEEQRFWTGSALGI